MKENIQEQIEAYIQGKLKGEQLRQFETTLAQDKALQESVEWEHNMHIALKNSGLEKVLPMIKEAVDNTFPELEPVSNKAEPIKPNSKPNLSKVAWAAIIGAIILTNLITYWVVSSQNESTSQPQDIFQHHFEPQPQADLKYQYPSYEVVSDSDQNNEELVKKIKGYFQNNQFRQALATIEQLEVNGWQPDELYIYKANALLTLGEMVEALKIYQNLLNTANSIGILNEVRWYMGLAYLNSNQLNKAKELFQLLESQKSPYLQQTKDILKDINQL